MKLVKIIGDKRVGPEKVVASLCFGYTQYDCTVENLKNARDKINHFLKNEGHE